MLARAACSESYLQKSPAGGGYRARRTTMQRLSIARSLRFALLGLTLVLAVVAVLGVSSLYNARQRYENTLAQTSAAGDRGGQPAGVLAGRRRELRSAVADLTALASGDPSSAQLAAREVRAEDSPRALATRGQLTGSQPTGRPAPAGSLARERGQARQLARQARARPRRALTPAERWCWSPPPGRPR